ncbi:hypothetical protein GH714_032019 [Hevea brasiliensis]|uniref:Uncharacterized protein n=1 Tax=Hevea brasiliensis TaxID=3981 RepID=A0A6A6LIL4_HEVBR|nr:hypothetical protein GH714_032019 [Hevea brasiliensis]
MEVQATMVVKPEADQACGSHDLINMEDEASGSRYQTIGVTEELSDIIIHGKHLLERLDSLKQAGEKPVKTRIQRVPYMLWENKKLEKYYKPRVIAMGPIHHDGTSFEYGERMKRILAGQFMKEYALVAENLYMMIMKDLGNLKMCYVEDVLGKHTKELREVPPCHLLGLLRQATGVDFKAENKARPFITGDSPTFHSSTQLTVSGIRFKPFYGASLEISFKRGFWGILRLPPVIVDESLFLPMFLSLASYEKCPDFLNGKEVTSYIWFLDSLIHHPDDVKVLREAGILINFFGSDEEIAELFKMVAKDLVPNPDLYSNLRFEIEVHYKKKWRPRIYQLIKVSQDYWTMLKVGAFITIFLTVVQTYFALPLHKSKT